MNAPIDISGVVLTTERLTLRPWRPEDLHDLYAYASVDGVGQMAGWAPHPDVETSRQRLAHFIEGKKTFAVELCGRAVGSLGVDFYNEEKLPEFADLRGRELGFVLAKDCWGRGLMPEAVKRVERYLFEDVGLDFLLCAHFRENGRSARVQQKCGFTFYKLGVNRTGLGSVQEICINLLRRADWERLAAEEKK